MENIGKILQNAREGLHKSHFDIHQETRVAVEHLQLIESNNFNFLPETYVKSFLRSFADAVGLDAEKILEQYEAGRAKSKAMESTSVQAASESPPPESKVRIIAWALAIGTLMLVLPKRYLSHLQNCH